VRSYTLKLEMPKELEQLIKDLAIVGSLNLLLDILHDSAKKRRVVINEILHYYEDSTLGIVELAFIATCISGSYLVKIAKTRARLTYKVYPLAPPLTGSF